MSSKKKRVVKIVKHSFEGGIEQILDIVKQQRDKVKEVVEKHNELTAKLSDVEKRQQQIAVFAAQEFGKLMAQTRTTTQSLVDSIDHLDLNVLSMVEILKELFGQITQADHFFKKLAHGDLPPVPGNDPLELSEEEIKQVKDEAETWYNDVVASAFKKVQDRRAEEDRRRAEELKKQKEAAEQAAKDEQEKRTVEKELQSAAEQERGVQVVGTGGPGAAIPEGADVFGG